MPKFISSSRLELRPVSLKDFEFLIKMQTHPKIMAHIGSGTVRTVDQIKEAVDRYLILQKQYPFLGQWVIKEKITQEDIGTILLRPPATLEKIKGLEMGFSYIPETWGKGFATEAGKAVIEYVRTFLPGEVIIAMVDPKNGASKKVLEKIGMLEVGEATFVHPVTGDKKTCLLLEFKGA